MSNSEYQCLEEQGVIFLQLKYLASLMIGELEVEES